MRFHASIAVATLATSFFVSVATLQAFDDAKYPDLSGQWTAVRLGVRGQPAFDPTKPWGLGQEAPLTPEYQKVLEDSMAEQAKGGIGNYPSARCILGGMPRIMSPNRQEYIITPETTYILTDLEQWEIRRIFTDGRDWPTEIEPIGVTQERTARPPISTVQAPHWASPQPNFAPLSSRSLRKT